MSSCAENKLLLRRMSIEDYEQVYVLWLSCKGMGLNNVDDSRAGIARYLARNPNTCFLAEEEGRVLGAILAGHDGRRGFIYHACVSPDARGRGIGTKMAEAVLDALREEGIPGTDIQELSMGMSGDYLLAAQEGATHVRIGSAIFGARTPRAPEEPNDVTTQGGY